MRNYKKKDPNDHYLFRVFLVLTNLFPEIICSVGFFCIRKQPNLPILLRYGVTGCI